MALGRTPRFTSGGGSSPGVATGRGTNFRLKGAKGPWAQAQMAIGPAVLGFGFLGSVSQTISTILGIKVRSEEEVVLSSSSTSSRVAANRVETTASRNNFAAADNVKNWEESSTDPAETGSELQHGEFLGARKASESFDRAKRIREGRTTSDLPRVIAEFPHQYFKALIALRGDEVLLILSSEGQQTQAQAPLGEPIATFDLTSFKQGQVDHKLIGVNIGVEFMYRIAIVTAKKNKLLDSLKRRIEKREYDEYLHVELKITATEKWLEINSSSLPTTGKIPLTVRRAAAIPV